MNVHMMTRPHVGEALAPAWSRQVGGGGQGIQWWHIILGWEIRTKDLKAALPHKKTCSLAAGLLVALIKASRGIGGIGGIGVYDWSAKSHFLSDAIEPSFSE
jgi:hypothetical protein